MMRRCAILTQRREMLGGTIAHVGFPAKAGKIARDGDHEAVTMLLGNDARRRNAWMQCIAADDRARLMRILRECGPVRPLLFSLFPENPDPLLEQDHMLYGKASNIDAVATPYFETYSAPLQIEGI